MSDIVNIRKRVDELLNERHSLKKQYLNEKTKLQETKELVIDIEQAQIITQQLAQKIQQQAHDKIAGVVSKCLETVFDRLYKFNINFEMKRGRTEAALTFEREGIEVDPMTASGGGVVDVAAFALRLSCLILSKPILRRILILDEPFKFVSAEYRNNVRMLLEGLAKEFNVQFIMVTHIPELQTGKVIEL